MTSSRIVDWWSSKRLPLYQATREVITIALITLTPVWAGVILSLLLKEIPTFYQALHANTGRGDLFLLAGAMMAPLALYISVRRDALPKPLTIYFPGGWLFWPVPGSEDTELGVFMGPEVSHGETEVYAGVQA